jgi:hypothetical protein
MKVQMGSSVLLETSEMQRHLIEGPDRPRLQKLGSHQVYGYVLAAASVNIFLIGLLRVAGNTGQRILRLMHYGRGNTLCNNTFLWRKGVARVHVRRFQLATWRELDLKSRS